MPRLEAFTVDLVLAAEPRHSVCVLGPTGLGQDGVRRHPDAGGVDRPAVVTSVKADVLDATEDRRGGTGPVVGV